MWSGRPHAGTCQHPPTKAELPRPRPPVHPLPERRVHQQRLLRRYRNHLRTSRSGPLQVVGPRTLPTNRRNRNRATPRREHLPQLGGLLINDGVPAVLRRHRTLSRDHNHRTRTQHRTRRQRPGIPRRPRTVGPSRNRRSRNRPPREPRIPARHTRRSPNNRMDRPSGERQPMAVLHRQPQLDQLAHQQHLHHRRSRHHQHRHRLRPRPTILPLPLPHRRRNLDPADNPTRRGRRLPSP